MGNVVEGGPERTGVGSVSPDLSLLQADVDAISSAMMNRTAGRLNFNDRECRKKFKRIFYYTE